MADLGGRALGSAILFISSIFLARILSPEDFGIVAMVMVIISIAETIVEVGFGSAIIQRLKVSELETSSAFYVNLLMGALISAAMFFSANLISQFYQQPELIRVVKWLSPIIFIGSLTTIQIALYNRKMKFETLSIINVISSLLAAIVAIIAAFKGAGFWALVIQNGVMYTIRSILIWAKSDWRPGLYFSFKSLKPVWRYSSNIFFAQAINMMFARLDAILIAKYFQASALGFYNRAKALNDLTVQYSSGSLGKVMFPVLSAKQNDKQNFNMFFKETYRVLSLTSIVVASVLYITAQDLIVLIFTAKWITTAVYLQIIVFGIFFQNANFIVAHTIKASGNSGVFLRAELVKKLLMTLAFIIGVNFGVEGIIYAYLSGKILAYMVSVILLIRQKIVGIKPVLLIPIKDMLFCIVPILLSIILSDYATGIAFIIGTTAIFIATLSITHLLYPRRAIKTIISQILNFKK